MRIPVTYLVLAALVFAQNPPASNPTPSPNPAPSEKPAPADPAPTTGSDPAPQVPIPQEQPAKSEPLAPVGGTPPKIPSAPSKDDFPYWGTVKGKKVRLRGGAGDGYAILSELESGTPIRVIEKSDEWLRVEVPGGYAAFVALAGGSKTYIQESTPGDGVVMVDDLMVRGSASTDFPPLGKLKAGDHVMILDRKDNFARIVAPSSAKAYIHGQFVARGADQEALAADFLTRHRKNESVLVTSGSHATELVTKEDKRVKNGLKAKEAFDRFDAESSKKIEERDTEATRQLLKDIVNESPEGDPLRAKAEEMLVHVQEWDSTRSELARARERISQAAAMAKAAEDRYAEDLKDYKRKREEIAEANLRGPQKPPYVAMGTVKRTPLTPNTADLGGAPFALYQGATTRLFVIESERYDLSYYADKLVGVLIAEGPESRAGCALKVLKITKLEILDSGG